VWQIGGNGAFSGQRNCGRRGPVDPGRNPLEPVRMEFLFIVATNAAVMMITATVVAMAN